MAQIQPGTPVGPITPPTVYAEQGSTRRVYYGETFTAPCSNDIWDNDGTYWTCAGTLTFGPADRDAACGTCGARCGRLVAFGLPSGDPFLIGD